MGLIAHWKMDRDCRDSCGNLNGKSNEIRYVEGVDGFPCGAAYFNGINSFVEVPDHHLLHFGTKPFTFSLWVKTDDVVTNAFGDIANKYHSDIRRGINLSIGSSSAGYSSVSDYRNVRFGIDDDVVSPWSDCGKPSHTNTMISCMAVFEGRLYAGIADSIDPFGACRIYRYEGGTEWTDCGRLGNDLMTLTVQSIIVHDGGLYAGTGVWDWEKAVAGIGGPDHVYCYEGGKVWRDCGKVGEGFRILCLASFNGFLYAGDDTGKCYRYDGEGKWDFCGQLGNEMRIYTMMVWNNHLYGGAHGNIYRYDGDTQWTCIGKSPFGITQVHKLQVFEGFLHCGTWPHGKILRFDGKSEWMDIGQVGIGTDIYQINEVNDLVVYNGKLYSGVIPKAEVYRYDGGTDWMLLKSLVLNPDFSPETKDIASWNRVPCLCAFNGKLYAGTSTCHGRASNYPINDVGRIFSMEAGMNVSYDKDIGKGWKLITAIRGEKYLKLYINGQLKSISDSFAGKKLDVSNDAPLLIGFGSQNYFSGAIDDFRIFDNELDEKEIRKLYKLKDE